MEQARVLTLIEQAIEALESVQVPTPLQVQSYLKERHNIDLPLDQVSGNMQIIDNLRKKEGESDGKNSS